MKQIFILLIGLFMFGSSQPFDEKDPRAVIEKVRIYRLTQELDLSSDQAVLFFPKLNELQKLDREFNKQKMDILFELRELLRQQADQGEIIKRLNKYQVLQKKRYKDKFEKMKELWEILTPIQQAKFLIFEDDFNREIREMIKKVKKFHKP